MRTDGPVGRVYWIQRATTAMGLETAAWGFEEIRPEWRSHLRTLIEREWFHVGMYSGWIQFSSWQTEKGRGLTLPPNYKMWGKRRGEDTSSWGVPIMEGGMCPH